MKHIKLNSKRGRFTQLAATGNCQAIKMTLRPGEATEPEPDNEHPRCEQWLFVVSGHGEARIGKKARRVKLEAQSLLLVEKGEPHQITNAGRTPLVTLNFYCPPAYDTTGKLRPSAKRGGLIDALIGK